MKKLLTFIAAFTLATAIAPAYADDQTFKTQPSEEQKTPNKPGRKSLTYYDKASLYGACALLVAALAVGYFSGITPSDLRTQLVTDMHKTVNSLKAPTIDNAKNIGTLLACTAVGLALLQGFFATALKNIGC
jgi:hypothetical protein